MTNIMHFNFAKEELTETQELVYKTLIRLFNLNQAMPTVKEVAIELDRYPNTVHGVLNILERKGFIERSTKSRGIKFTHLRVQLVAA